MRTNVRIGNDIKLLWEVLRGGYPVNFNNATDIKVSILQGGKYSCEDKTEISTFEIDTEQNNLLNIEIQADKITELGYLWVVLEYTIGDHGLVDGNRKITIDNLPVKIVGLSDEAGQVFEFEVTSDVVVGFDGKSAFEVWLVENPDKTLQDYFDWLQQPATDIEQVVSSNETVRVSSEETRQLNETARIEAETLRGSAETQRISNENTRKSNETGRINAETLRLSAEEERGTAEGLRASSETSRNTAEGQRATAETARATAEGLRQSNTATAIINAEQATENANTAAQNADDAREAIQGDLALKANHGYGEGEEPKTLKQVEDNTSVKMTNLIVNGDFRNGTSGWSLWGNAGLPIQGIWVIENNRVVFKSKLIGANGRFEQDILCDIGDKFYIAIDKEGEGSLRLTVSDYESGSNSITIVGNLSSTVTTINRKNYRLSIGYDEGTNLNNFSFSEVRAINLTATFGAGNEPTKEEFELLLDFLGIDYFEGEITIPAQKIMQWQLALIRKNKNAIIALGGTII